MADSGAETHDTWATARGLARTRGERLSSIHVLAVLAAEPGPAQRLLATHGIDGTWVRLRATLSAEPASVLEQAEASAGRLARSLRARSTGAIHLLAALLRMPESAAHRVLAASGIEIDHLSGAVHGYLSGAPRWRSRAREPGVAPPAAGRPARPSGGGPSTAVRRTGERVEKPAERIPLPPAPDGRAAETRPVAMPARRAVPAAAPRPAPARPARQVPSARAKPGPWLAAHTRDLRRAAAAAELDPAVARDELVDRLLDVLGKRRSSSPCLVGPSGVGKTAIVHALAQRLAADPEAGIALLEVPADALAGAGGRGAAAEGVRRIAAEAAALGERVVLAVGDLGPFARAVADAGEGAEAALREALESRALAVLAESDPATWERALRSAPGLVRCLTPVDVGEPDDAAATAMLAAVSPRYGAHHGVEIAPEAIEAAVRIARRYVVGRALPDKALQLLDVGAARARRAGRPAAGAAEIATVAAELVGVPRERLLATDGQRLLALEDELGRRIVGHREALARLSDVLRRNAAGFRGPRPIGSFLFLGPTGVGKTETARAVAESLFPGRESLLRLDMSEYAEPHSVARLVGAPPGYVGFEAGGMLADALRRRPYQVVLFDEFEKAHPDVHRLLLQVLEDGRLTDGRGQTVDFRNTVVVLTSNLGSELFVERKAVGFGRTDTTPAAAQVLAAARRALPPELWNRIDETLVFQPLLAAEVRRIAELLLAATCAAAADGRGVTVEAGEGLVEHLLASGGYDPAMGARPMRRAIQRLVEAPLARALLRPGLAPGARLRIVVQGGDVAVVQEPATGEAACA
ncbi:MAG: ATP-dependent Clp protease ATP-binding subunit [Deltaproteobacteria bacterium]|nr:ATP-dependent Clp protease ATP-binding subunit [Deltaproteobacteria bacterium]